MQITLTFDLTEDNIDKLKTFCIDTKATTKVTTKKTTKKQVKEVPAIEATELINEATENITGTCVPGGGEQDDSVLIASPGAVMETEKAKEKTTVTKTDVRAVALKISKAGKSDILREIFSKFGATNLKGIAEEDYEALMRELVAVNV